MNSAQNLNLSKLFKYSLIKNIMKKKSILVLILLFSLFIFGCQSNQKNKQQLLDIFIGGNEGLEFSFKDNQPPIKVLDENQDPFFITLILKNKGEYTVHENKIISSLSGVNSEAFSLSSLNSKLNIPLEGKLKSGDQIIESSPEELQFDQANYKYNLNSDFPTSLRADICYLYKTKAISKVCLKKKSVERATEDKCLINSDKVVTEVSGAPVKIKDVKQRSSSTNDIKLTFTIINEGKGNIYGPETFTDKCIDISDEKNKVLVEVNSPSGNKNIKCSQLQNNNKGLIKLALKEKIINCNIATNNLQEIAFEEPINIELDYFYKESIEKQITVVNSEQ